MGSTITVQNLVDWARTNTRLVPLTNVGGLNAVEPAVSIANDVFQKIICMPYRWWWNRASATSFITVDGTAEYTLAGASNFFFIDRAYMEYEASTTTPKTPLYTLQPVRELQKTDLKLTPFSKITVDRFSAGAPVVRFEYVPDATIYRVYVDFQQIPTKLTALNNTFTPVPDEMGSLLRQLFLAEAMRFSEDKRYLNEMAIAEQMLAKYRQVYDTSEPDSPMFAPESDLLMG